MVVLTRSSHRKACESFESTSSLQKIIVPPPWCSLAKAQKKPRKVGSRTWERRSLSPSRTDICEYLHGDKRKLYKRKHTRACCKQTPAKNKGYGRTLIYLAFLFAALAMITTFWMSESIQPTSLISKVIPKANLISFFGLEHSLVQEECCSRMKYLLAELLRAEQLLRSTLRLKRTLMLTSKTRRDDSIERGFVHGVRASRGLDTKEWGGKGALWGVVPLWRAAPPPDTMLSLRRPVPSDCWPFSGSYGELVFELPNTMRLRCVSVEHIQPDAALSAPKRFIVYGILANGTWLTAAKAEYKNKGPAKQYYPLLHQNIPIQRVVLRVLSNQGNPQYTCIYRVHFYENVLDSKSYVL